MGIEKGAVLQEARVFNDPQLDARRCSQVFLLLFLIDLMFSLCYSMVEFDIEFVCYLFLFQVITKLLYLLNQGETFTKVKRFSFVFSIS